MILSGFIFSFILIARLSDVVVICFLVNVLESRDKSVKQSQTVVNLPDFTQ